MAQNGPGTPIGFALKAREEARRKMAGVSTPGNPSGPKPATQKPQGKLSRGDRNNNPGNIRNSKTVWVGEITPSKDKSFKQFSSMAYGYRAVIKLLQNYRKLYNLKTIAELINRWAPPTENKTGAYITRVCKEMKVSSSYVPDIEDKATMCAMAAAISLVENGTPANMDDIEKGWNLL